MECSWFSRFVVLCYFFLNCQLLSSAQAQENEIRFPIQVYQVTVEDLGPTPESCNAHNPPFSEDVVVEAVQLMNEIWGQCSIQFDLQPMKRVSLASASLIKPTSEGIQRSKVEFYEEIEKPVGSSRFDSYIGSLGEIKILIQNFSKWVMQKEEKDIGIHEVPILILPHFFWDSWGKPQGITLATLTRDAMLDFYNRAPMNGEIDQTRMVLYSYEADSKLHFPNSDGSPGKEVSVLAHEVGHFLGLNHEYDRENLMDGGAESNFIPSHQCSYARNYLLRKKLNAPDVTSADGRTCREYLSERICYQGDGSVSPVCGSNSYAAQSILNVYDQYPDFLKKELCSLERIWLSDTARSAGELVQAPTKDGKQGFSIILNQKLIDGTVFIDQFLTWKEQLNFGGSLEYGVPSPVLPQVSGRHYQGSNLSLPFILAHELGHLIDFKYGIQKDWMPISWATSEQPKIENEFPHRNQLCFFWCDGSYLDIKQGLEMYQGLMSTNFVDAYASVDSSEDFAETFAFYVLEQFKEFDFSLEIPKESGPRQEYDLKSHYLSDRLKVKRDFIDQWVKGR